MDLPLADRVDPVSPLDHDINNDVQNGAAAPSPGLFGSFLNSFTSLW